MEVIEAKPNPFGGIVPVPDLLTDDPREFKDQLRDSLSGWREEGYKVVWLELPTSKAALVPMAVEAGFSFHHAQEGYAMLTRQLVEDAYIPPYATHYIGVGGVVINDKNELLIVSERYRRRGSGPAYKLPGGALQPGEHLVDAAEREVLEETGVSARFQSLHFFRHWHGYRYGKSDIYFVCRLSPSSTDITMQSEELAECLWMPVQEFLDREDVSPFNKRIVRSCLENPGIVSTGTIDGYGDPAIHEFFMPMGS